MDSAIETLRRGAFPLLLAVALACGEGCSSKPRPTVTTTPWIENGKWLGSIEVRETLSVPRSVRFVKSDCLATPRPDGDRSCLVRLEARMNDSEKIAPLYALEFDYADDRVSDERAGRLRALIDAYDRGLSVPLTDRERRALPLALARAPLCFVGMIASTDSEAEGRRLAADLMPDVRWALSIAREPDRWQDAFAAPID